jgi:hypothetical protein
MTPDRFRDIALGMAAAVESAHMGHPDFRLEGRIFATLRPDRGWGMVTLGPDDQSRFVRDHPDAFEPESGAWGRAGCTRVLLDAVAEDALGEAMTLAWQLAAAKGQARKSKPRRTTKAPSSVGKR